VPLVIEEARIVVKGTAKLSLPPICPVTPF